MRSGVAPGGAAEDENSMFVEVKNEGGENSAAVIMLKTERNVTCGAADGWMIAESCPATQHP